MKNKYDYRRYCSCQKCWWWFILQIEIISTFKIPETFEKAARIFPSMNHYHVSIVKYFICHLMKIKDLYLHVDLYVLGLISQALPTSRFAFVV